jgi:hypothetical protein
LWSDPRVLAEIEKSCAFDPDELKGEERKKWTGTLYPGSHNIMSCYTGFDQSCVYDPCWDVETRECQPRCNDGCRSCGKECRAACESCKSGCKDDACRKGCARTCADCHERCVRTRDRCATGTCAEGYRACRLKLKSDWRRNGCKELCQKYLACQKPCIKKHEAKGDSYEACTKPCEPKNLRGCQMTFCGGNFGMGVDPEAYR